MSTQARNTVLWGAAIISLFILITIRYVNAFVPHTADIGLAYNLIISPVNLLFLNNIIFAVIVYISRKDYCNAFAFLRLKDKIKWLYVTKALFLSVLHCTVVFVSVVIILVLYGVPIERNFYSAIPVMLIYDFLFYQLYFLQYMLFKNHIISIMVVSGIAIIIELACLYDSFVHENSGSFCLLLYNLRNPIIAIFFAIVSNGWIVWKKEIY